MAFEVQNFQEDVLDASRELPVLVDFWAPWCAPCRILGPVLEKLAAENEGTWKLVKINTDENQDLSIEYGIRGIPAVKLFVDAKVVNEFVGALPEPQVRRWLDQAIPNEQTRRVFEALDLLEAGEVARAEALLRQVIEDDPRNAQALAILAQVIVFAHPSEAVAFASGASDAEPRLAPYAEVIKTIAHLLERQQAPEILPEGPARATYQAALNAIAQQDFDTALTHFIDVIRTDRYYDDDGARKACIALFALLGERHPLTQKHRRPFDMALY